MSIVANPTPNRLMDAGSGTGIERANAGSAAATNRIKIAKVVRIKTSPYKKLHMRGFVQSAERTRELPNCPIKNEAISVPGP